jgi:hypothetical protein
MRIMRRVREARLEWKGRERALLRLHSRGKVRDQKELEKVTCRRSWIARRREITDENLH